MSMKEGEPLYTGRWWIRDCRSAPLASRRTDDLGRGIFQGQGNASQICTGQHIASDTAAIRGVPSNPPSIRSQSRFGCPESERQVKCKSSAKLGKVHSMRL